MSEKYPRYIVPGFKPFDPIKIAKITENLVTKNNMRKYTAFYCVPVYRGIATGYAVGCCLRCFYCWSGPSRDFPEKYGEYYSGRQVYEKLVEIARRGLRWREIYFKNIWKARISGCEPTIGRKHLLKLLDLIEDSSQFKLFILETNGILIGYDKSYAKDLSKYSKIHVRVSIKAGTPEGFTWRTGGIGKFYELPFKALKFLLDMGVSCHAAAMTDRRIMSKDERKIILRKLEEIDRRLKENLEEEVIDPYSMTLFRLRKAGLLNT